MKFSANLGFLWADLTLPDAIRAAKAAGFDAVEFHWPYDENLNDIKAALSETNLPLLGLNTRRGNVAKGEMGMCAIPGRTTEARDAIERALEWGAALGATNLHVMAGFAEGLQAEEVFKDNLRYACAEAATRNMTILIEPLNAYDAPGYFLKTTDQARTLIETLDLPNLKLMFDCYHVARTEGDVISRLNDVMHHIGHIQFAAVPDRGPPDQGDLSYADVFEFLQRSGYKTPLGAEYRPKGHTNDTLEWLVRAR